MPRNRGDVLDEKLGRLKDQAVRLRGQSMDNSRAAGRAMMELMDFNSKFYTRTYLADRWKTSLSQVDRMVARARADAE